MVTWKDSVLALSNYKLSVNLKPTWWAFTLLLLSLGLIVNQRPYSTIWMISRNALNIKQRQESICKYNKYLPNTLNAVIISLIESF